MISNLSQPGSKSGLPQDTMSLCPECLSVLPAVLYKDKDRVWMSKTCPEHGEFIELISSDVAFFEKMDRWGTYSGPGVDRPVSETVRGCPWDCGLCASHQSSAMMINIDLTNRCNLRCPVCFANANASGRVYEVTVEQVQEMMDRSMKINTAAPPCVQFSGGEPTLHPDFLEILHRAKASGFAQVQVASNGLAFANDAELAAAASEAGLNVVYLQFDGISDEVYRQTRGRPLFEIKQKALEHIKQAGMQVCLVPTLVRGINDHEIGEIFRFAVDHVDTVVGISWQPVAFTGRIDHKQRLAMRFTLADLARALDEQTGGSVKMHRDWYPFSFLEPFSRLVEAITGERTPIVSCHRHCGSATYVIVDTESKAYRTLPEFVDMEPLMLRLGEIAKSLQARRWLRRIILVRALRDVPNYFRAERALPGWDSSVLMELMNSFVNFRERYPDNQARLKDLKIRRVRYLLMAAMHFQDAYNYQLARSQQCVIHCAAPDGRFYPFCTYNCGPTFREQVERRYSCPVSQPALAGPVIGLKAGTAKLDARQVSKSGKQ